MFVSPNCVRCTGTTFELRAHPIATSKFQKLFVICSTCGGVVATEETDNITAQIKQQNAVINMIAAALNVPIKPLPVL